MAIKGFAISTRHCRAEIGICGQSRIADWDNFSIRWKWQSKLDSGKRTKYFSLILWGIYCVADAVGNLYIGESCSKIRKVNQTGYVTTVAPNLASRPFGLVLDGFGKLYFTLWATMSVYSLHLDTGAVQRIYGNASSGIIQHNDGYRTSSELSSPNGLAIDELGNMYIVEYGSALISKANTTGYLSIFAGSGVESSEDGVGKDASFKMPRQIVFDSKGRLFVTENLGYSIRMINW